MFFKILLYTVVGFNGEKIMIYWITYMVSFYFVQEFLKIQYNILIIKIHFSLYSE